MIKTILGRPLVIGFQIIDAWPNYKNKLCRWFIWLSMAFTIACQFSAIKDLTHEVALLMDTVARSITNLLSIVKIVFLWKNRRLIEKCFFTMEQDWQKVYGNENIAHISRIAKISRRLTVYLLGTYYFSCIIFVLIPIFHYAPEGSGRQRELVLRCSYPFDAYRTPVFEVMLGAGVIQMACLGGGHIVADSALVALIAHACGQLDLLRDRILRLSSAEEVPDIVRTHERIIHFVEDVEIIFRWIGLAEFLSGSIIMCAIGFLIVTSLESDLDGATVALLGSYIVAMILGEFTYCFSGNILIEKARGISDAAYGSSWNDLPPQTSKLLILIMVRADKAICITAGHFFALDLESFVNILKTTASYLSVIRAMYE